MNKYLPKHDHASVTSTTTHLIANNNVLWSANKIILHTTKAIVNGSTQYPNTHTLWKNDLKRMIWKLICR